MNATGLMSTFAFHDYLKHNYHNLLIVGVGTILLLLVLVQSYYCGGCFKMLIVP